MEKKVKPKSALQKAREINVKFGSKIKGLEKENKQLAEAITRTGTLIKEKGEKVSRLTSELALEKDEAAKYRGQVWEKQEETEELEKAIVTLVKALK